MITPSPLFFVPAILIMIVPTITSSTTLVYAQIGTPAAASSTTTTISPTTTGNTTPTPTPINNFTNSINQTAAGGIQDMRQLVLSLESDIQRYNLTDTFNDVVLAFAYIQGNLTGLQNHTSTVTSEAAATVAQAQSDAAAANAALLEAQEELEAATTTDEEESEDEDVEDEEEESEEAEEEPEPESESATTATTTTTTTPSQTRADILEALVNNGGGGGDGPRLDPEGDGGFPGDIDG